MRWLEVQKYCNFESFILWSWIEHSLNGIRICCIITTQIKQGYH
jgi:hypothetical protein